MHSYIYGEKPPQTLGKKNAKWQKCLKNCTKIDHSNCSCLQIFFMSKKTRLDVFFCSSSLCCSSSNQSNCLRFELDDNSLRFFFLNLHIKKCFGGVSQRGNGMKFWVSMPSYCSFQRPQQSHVNKLPTLNPTSREFTYL